jgi:ribonuclease Z
VRTIQDAAKRAGNDNMVKITGDILDYHASPVEAAQSAQEAGADYLLFYHIVPPLPVAPLESIYLEGVGEVFSGKFKIGVDGTFISLPANAEAIEVGER